MGCCAYVEIGCRSLLKGYLSLVEQVYLEEIRTLLELSNLQGTYSHFYICLDYNFVDFCVVGFRHDSGVECCKLLFFQKIIGIVEEALSLLLPLLLEYSKIWGSWS